MAAPRTIWHEVIDARRAHHRTVTDSRETWRPDELDKWLAELLASLDIVADSVTAGDRDDDDSEPVDPRAALIELMAACAAWVDAMDGSAAP